MELLINYKLKRTNEIYSVLNENYLDINKVPNNPNFSTRAFECFLIDTWPIMDFQIFFFNW